MPNLINRFSGIGFKLFLSNLLVVLLPILIIGYFSYSYMIQSIQKQIQSSIAYALEQINQTITFQIHGIERSGDVIYADQSLSRMLVSYNTNWDNYMFLRNYVIPKLETAVNLPNETIMMKLYIDNPDLSEIYYREDGDPLTMGRRYELLHLQRIREKPWLKSLEHSGQKGAWMQIESDRQYGNISLVRTLVDYSSFKVIGVIVITTKLHDLFNLAGTGKAKIDGELVIVSDRGPEYFPGGSLDQATELLKDTNLTYRIESVLEPLHFKIVALMSKQSMERNGQRIRTLTIYICMLSFIILSGISYLINGYFTRRVKKITLSLNAFREGQFHKRIHYRGRDEFKEISSAFNEMATTIERLFHEIYESRIQMRTAELRVLQAQINPHFLYNTLSSISRMAKLGRIDVLHNMVQELARFYRLSLHNGEYLVPLSVEIEQIRSYATIQQMKLDNRFRIIYEIEDIITQYTTVKMIFQPFVENVLEHAWCGNMITIRIVGYLDQNEIHFKIIDDGIGMKREIVEQLFKEDGVRIGYGIYNVDERIKLQFGHAYGVKVFSRFGIGTSVHIHFPIYSS